MSTHDLDDSLSHHSGASSASSTNQKIECPVCKDELTRKHMFNHIRVKHEQFLQTQTTKQWLEAASEGKPLCIFWETSNDFDEMELTKLYACLGSNKTFQTECRAMAHFKKDHKALKEHNKKVKELLKNRKKALLSEAQKKKKEMEAKAKQLDMSEAAVKFRNARENNDPELCSEYEKVIQIRMDVCQRLCKDSENILNSITMSPDHPSMKQMTVKETHDLFSKIFNDWNTTSKKTFNYLRNTHYLLDRVLHIRRLLDGVINIGAEYAWYKSEDHNEGLLTRGDSEWANYF
jgi:hypothetical protein